MGLVASHKPYCKAPGKRTDVLVFLRRWRVTSRWVWAGAGRGGGRGRAWSGNAGPPSKAQQGPALPHAGTDLPAAGREQALHKVAPQEARAAGHQAALQARRAPPCGHHAVPSEAGWQRAARQGWRQQTRRAAGKVAVRSLALLALAHALLQFLSAGRPRALWRVHHVCALHQDTTGVLAVPVHCMQPKGETSSASQTTMQKERTFFMMASRFLGLPAMKTVIMIGMDM